VSVRQCYGSASPTETSNLAERGIEVDHVTVYRWVQRFVTEFEEAARARQHVIGDRWYVDETCVKVGGPGAACSGRSISSTRSSMSYFVTRLGYRGHRPTLLEKSFRPLRMPEPPRVAPAEFLA